MIGRTTPDSGFNSIKFRDLREHVRGDRRGPDDVDVVELASQVSPASSFDHTPGFVHRVIARERVSLQDALVVLEMGLRVNAPAIRRVPEPHRRGFGAASGTVVPCVYPQPTLFGLAVTWRKHTDRCVVSVQLRAGEHVLAQSRHQGGEQHVRAANPVTHRALA